MRTDEDTSPPVRYTTRWKRWVGYYLALGWGFMVVGGIPGLSWPLYTNEVILLSVEVILVAWGVYWIVRNPKATDQPDLGRGRPMLGVLVIVLLLGLLMLYQVLR